MANELNPFRSDNMEEISNNKLSRFFTVEIVGSMLFTAFVVGVTYSALAKDTKQAHDKTVLVETKQEEMEKDVTAIQIDVAVVRANQERIQEDLGTQTRKIEEQNRKLQEMNGDIKEVLRILNAK